MAVLASLFLVFRYAVFILFYDKVSSSRESSLTNAVNTRILLALNENLVVRQVTSMPSCNPEQLLQSHKDKSPIECAVVQHRWARTQCWPWWLDVQCLAIGIKQELLADPIVRQAFIDAVRFPCLDWQALKQRTDIHTYPRHRLTSWYASLRCDISREREVQLFDIIVVVTANDPESMNGYKVFRDTGKFLIGRNLLSEWIYLIAPLSPS